MRAFSVGAGYLKTLCGLSLGEWMPRLVSLLVVATGMQRFLCGSFSDCEYILANESTTRVSAG